MKKSFITLFALLTLVSSAFATEDILILNPANQRITFDRNEIQVDGTDVGEYGVFSSDILTLKQTLASAKAMGKLVKLSDVKTGSFRKIDLIEVQSDKSDALVRCESENTFLKELITHQMTSGVQSNRADYEAYSTEGLGHSIQVGEFATSR